MVGVMSGMSEEQKAMRGQQSTKTMKSSPAKPNTSTTHPQATGGQIPKLKNLAIKS
jgi:hypothetical protein